MTDAGETRAKAIPRAWIGLGCGLALGLCDFVALSIASVEMRHGEVDMSLPVMAVFTVTFAALGYAIGRLADARGKAKEDARIIGEQMREVERSQATVLRYERLASIGRMAASVAHEVRNPLGVIKSSAALLVDCVADDDDDAIKAGNFISAEIGRLDRFIRTLLDFSRPLTPEHQKVDGEALAQRIEELSGEAIARAGATLEMLPPRGQFHIDSEMIARAVVALAENAAQAAGDGGRVRIRIAEDRGTLAISVRDNGPGLCGEVADRLFEPFLTTKAKGTGLGLSTARRLVEAHGGTLLHREGEGLRPGGGGASFEITISAHEEMSAA